MHPFPTLIVMKISFVHVYLAVLLLGDVSPQKTPRRASAGQQGARCALGTGRLWGEPESFGGGQAPQGKGRRSGQQLSLKASSFHFA